MPTLSHACVRVLDLARSVAFYRETLGLTPQRELTMEDRGWHLVFLGDGVTPFQLELCRELQRTEPYRLGTGQRHLLHPRPRRPHPGDSSSRLIPPLFQDTSPLDSSRGLVSCRYEFVISCNF